MTDAQKKRIKQLQKIASKISTNTSSKSLVSLLKKSGLKASEFLRPFKIIPYKVENVSGLKEDLLQNRNVSNQLEKYEHELRKDHNGRLLVRQSGTEPIVRILVECDKKTVIDNFISKISNFLISKNKNL